MSKKKGKSKKQEGINVFLLLTVCCALLALFMLAYAIWFSPKPNAAFEKKTVTFAESGYHSESCVGHYYLIETKEGERYTMGTPKIADIDDFEEDVKRNDVITVGYTGERRKQTEICFLAKENRVYLTYDDYCGCYKQSGYYIFASIFGAIALICGMFSRLFK